LEIEIRNRYEMSFKSKGKVMNFQIEKKREFYDFWPRILHRRLLGICSKSNIWVRVHEFSSWDDINLGFPQETFEAANDFYTQEIIGQSSNYT
jgi:hypothetical protein